MTTPNNPPAYSLQRYAPPPPPPPRPSLQGLCPPPPPPPQYPICSQFPNPVQMQQHAHVTNYAMTSPLTNFSINQYQGPQTAHSYQQNLHHQHVNYLVPPPPPPPHHINKTRSNGANQINTNPIQSNNDKSTHAKKINPKMAKKYSGRGLKTITISGPGMPTQKFKICVGDHPEDVKKWIDERRKRFPRSGLVKRKDDTSHVVGHQETTVVGEKRGRDNLSDTAGVEPKKIKSIGGGGLSSLLSGYESTSSEEENETGGTILSSEKGKQLEELVNLKSCEVESDNHLTQMKEVGPVKPESSTLGKTKLCKFFKRGSCRHGDSCKFLHANKLDNNNKYTGEDSKRKAQSEQDKARRKYESELQALGLVTPGQSNRNGHKPVNNTSLLSKLLKRDKDREHRLTLQLLRYIVDSDFFQGQDEEDAKVNNETDDA